MTEENLEIIKAKSEKIINYWNNTIIYGQNNIWSGLI